MSTYLLDNLYTLCFLVEDGHEFEQACQDLRSTAGATEDQIGLLKMIYTTLSDHFAVVGTLAIAENV